MQLPAADELEVTPVVIARCRPPSESEKVWGLGEEKPCVSLDPDSRATVVVSNANSPEQRSFPMDDVFIGNNGSQESVFNCVGRPIVDDLMKGYNGAIITMGPSESGKSYTMWGPDYLRPHLRGISMSTHRSSSPLAGIAPRAVSRIMQCIEGDESGSRYTLSVTLLEVYREVARDLLSPDLAVVGVREALERPIVLVGCSHRFVNSRQDFDTVLHEATQRLPLRDMGQTIVARLDLSRDLVDAAPGSEQARTAGSGQGCDASLWLLDMAGCERIPDTLALDADLVNRPINAFCACLNALVDAREHSVPETFGRVVGGATAAQVANALGASGETSLTEGNSTLKGGHHVARPAIGAMLDSDGFMVNDGGGDDDDDDDDAVEALTMKKRSFANVPKRIGLLHTDNLDDLVVPDGTGIGPAHVPHSPYSVALRKRKRVKAAARRAAVFTGVGKPVPYGDSLVTKIMTQPLGGNSRANLIVCCSPHPVFYNETIFCLRVAGVFRRLRAKIRPNIRLSRRKMDEAIAYYDGHLREQHNRARALQDVFAQHASIPLSSLDVEPPASFAQSQMSREALVEDVTRQCLQVEADVADEVDSLEEQVAIVKSTLANLVAKEDAAQRELMHLLQCEGESAIHTRNELRSREADFRYDSTLIALEMEDVSAELQLAAVTGTGLEERIAQLNQDLTKATVAKRKMKRVLKGAQSKERKLQRSIDEARAEVEELKQKFEAAEAERERLLAAKDEGYKRLQDMRDEVLDLTRLLGIAHMHFATIGDHEHFDSEKAAGEALVKNWEAIVDSDSFWIHTLMDRIRDELREKNGYLGLLYIEMERMVGIIRGTLLKYKEDLELHTQKMDGIVKDAEALHAKREVQHGQIQSLTDQLVAGRARGKESFQHIKRLYDTVAAKEGRLHDARREALELRYVVKDVERFDRVMEMRALWQQVDIELLDEFGRLQKAYVEAHQSQSSEGAEDAQHVNTNRIAALEEEALRAVVRAHARAHVQKESHGEAAKAKEGAAEAEEVKHKKEKKHKKKKQDGVVDEDEEEWWKVPQTPTAPPSSVSFSPREAPRDGTVKRVGFKLDDDDDDHNDHNDHNDAGKGAEASPGSVEEGEGRRGEEEEEEEEDEDAEEEVVMESSSANHNQGKEEEVVVTEPIDAEPWEKAGGSADVLTPVNVTKVINRAHVKKRKYCKRLLAQHKATVFEKASHKRGYLWIKNKLRQKKWGKGYFVQEGSSLRSYASQIHAGFGRTEPPMSVVELTNGTIIEHAERIANAANAFSVAIPGYQPMYFACPTRSEADAWMESLLFACDPKPEYDHKQRVPAPPDAV